MLLELESKDVNNKLDNEQYNSSNTKLLMKKLTPNVKYTTKLLKLLILIEIIHKKIRR